MNWFKRQSVKTGIVAAAVAAVTAGVMAAAPALGQTGQPRQPGQVTAIPIIKSGWKNGPVNLTTSVTPVTVAKMSLAAGKWAIFAKAYLQDNGAFTVLMNCQLVAGADFDITRPQLEAGGGNAYSQSIALNVVHTFATSGAVRLKCATFGVPVSVNFIKITAIKAGTLTNVQLP